MNFHYQLKERVRIAASGEEGEIVGRAEYTTGEPSYLLRYRASDGRAVEAWWAQNALALTEAQALVRAEAQAAAEDAYEEAQAG